VRIFSRDAAGLSDALIASSSFRTLRDCVGAPANVPVPEVGTKEPVIGKERWEEIRRMRAEGQAVSQIARRCVGVYVRLQPLQET
jgi:hypothetical protein